MKRYKLTDGTIDGHPPVHIEHPDGGWVTYDDAIKDADKEEP